MKVHWRRSARVAVGVAAIVALAVPATAASARPRRSAAVAWAPAATATVHPGVMTYTEGGQCTANFVYTDGTDVYIGQAAHCAGTGGNTETDGCLAGSLPLGTPVEVDGASQPGTLAYSSWLTMQEVGEQDASTCAYNDLALVRLDPADHDVVNPSVPFWGGPVALDTDDTVAGERVLSYGNSSLRFGISQLSPKDGISLGSTDGWTHNVYTVTPGIPGDSGSAFLDAEGDAIGVLSTLQIAPIVGSNGVSDLASMLDYMRAHTALDGVQLALGTEPFAAGTFLGL